MDETRLRAEINLQSRFTGLQISPEVTGVISKLSTKKTQFDLGAFTGEYGHLKITQ